MLGPSYIRNFKCIADKCRHSCCIGWEIDIDGGTHAKYRECDALHGTNLCGDITLSEGGACFTMREDGSCPRLTDDGLCDIILSLGEDYLSDICREHPRFYHECGGVQECGVGLCCEAAAELILTSDGWGELIPTAEGESAVVPEAPAGFDIRRERDRIYESLGRSTVEYEDRVEEIRHLCKITERELCERVAGVLPALEYMSDDTQGLLTLALKRKRSTLYDEPLQRALAYFIFRYASPACSEAEMISGLRLALALEQILACVLGMPTIVDKYGIFECARMLSEELEYSEDNIDILRFALG